MCEYWDTEEAMERSLLYSKACLSDSNGLGPHIHLLGPKSYQQIQHEPVNNYYLYYFFFIVDCKFKYCINPCSFLTSQEEELGRPVSIVEVFIKTHTKPDGTYVDRKAEKIVQNYEKKLQQKLFEGGRDFKYFRWEIKTSGAHNR